MVNEDKYWIDLRNIFESMFKLDIPSDAIVSTISSMLVILLLAKQLKKYDRRKI